jgi:hypothetical protein
VAWRAGKPNDQEAAAAGVEELVEEDAEEEDDEDEDDVEESDEEDEDDEVVDVESGFLVSAPFDFSAPAAPERESLR